MAIMVHSGKRNCEYTNWFRTWTIEGREYRICSSCFEQPCVQAGAAELATGYRIISRESAHQLAIDIADGIGIHYGARQGLLEIPRRVDPALRTNSSAYLVKRRVMLAFARYLSKERGPNVRSGVVYLVKAEGVDAVKIGTAKCVHSRIKELQIGSPCKLSLAAFIYGDSTLERELHKKFQVHRLHGEWFRLSPEILSEFSARAGRLKLAPRTCDLSGDYGAWNYRGFSKVRCIEVQDPADSYGAAAL
jgi:hypothetical protein